MILAPQCSKRWGARCAASKGRKCKCACGGHNHGRSNPLSAVHEFTKRELRAREEIDMFGQLDVRRDDSKLFYPSGSPPERPPLEDVENARVCDDRVIQFGRDRNDARIFLYTPARDGDASSCVALEQRVVYHSPTGMEFGYGGSGPADTAINVLALVVPIREAVRLHQYFKDEFIGNIPRSGGELRLSEVRDWVATYYTAELNDPALMAREHEMRENLAEIARLDAEADATGVAS